MTRVTCTLNRPGYFGARSQTAHEMARADRPRSGTRELTSRPLRAVSWASQGTCGFFRYARGGREMSYNPTAGKLWQLGKSNDHEQAISVDPLARIPAKDRDANRVHRSMVGQP